MPTDAPRRASSTAVARPMPPLAPVTRAIFLARLVMDSSCPESAGHPGRFGRRRTDDEMAVEHDLAARRRRLLLDTREQELGGEPALLLRRLAHGGERRRHERGERDVVEARHRDVV